MLDFGYYNMDCLQGMKQIDSGTVDLILSDLPYGITQCEWDNPVPLDLFWEQAMRIIKDNGAIVLTAKQPFTTDLINSNREWYHYNLVWVKNISTGFYNAKVMPLQTHEDICVFYKHKPTYNPQMQQGFERKVSKASSKRKCQSAEIYNKAICTKDYDSTERYPISLLYFESDKHKNALHPTQKPVALFEYLIRTFSNEGDLVVDGFGGSNTTGVACFRTGRKYIGFEKEKKYFDIGTERIKHETKQLSIFDVG